MRARQKSNRNLSILFLGWQPKGPFRTENTTTIVQTANYYAVVFLLRPPNLLRRGPFFERENVGNSQENGVRARCAAVVNHPVVLKILPVVNLLRVLFLVRRGPLGSSNTYSMQEGQAQTSLNVLRPSLKSVTKSRRLVAISQ